MMRGPMPPVANADFYRLAMVEDWYLDGGHKSRLLLALLSRLPNEVDWAFDKLLLLSFVCPDAFALIAIPGLLDAMLDYVGPFLDCCDPAMTELTDIKNDHLMTDKTNTVLARLFNKEQMACADLERTLQVMHILRNFSFLAVNINMMLAHPTVMRLVRLGLRPDLPVDNIELRLNSLDILDNLAGIFIFFLMLASYVISCI